MAKPDLYTPNLHALKMLKNDSTTAWITPEGMLHVVPLFNHLGYFVDNPDILPEATAFLARFADVSGKLSISGPHMAEAIDRIYSSGWGRVGTFGGDKFELDCASEHMVELRRKAKHLARMLNRALVCKVTQPFQKPSKKHSALARDSVWTSLVDGFVGWVSPDGSIFECPPHAPFATFVDDPDRLPETAKTFADAVKEDASRQSDEFWQYSQEVDPDGHVEWHRFDETPYDPDIDERREMTAVVLSHGWGSIRVDTRGVVILETSADHLDDLADKLRRSVAPVNCEVDARTFLAGSFNPSSGRF
jgi:hypothetical protein